MSATDLLRYAGSPKYSTFSMDDASSADIQFGQVEETPLTRSHWVKDLFVPKETGDMKVLWAKRTLAAIGAVAFLSAACEIWIIVNEATIKNHLLGSVTENGANDIWFNFKVELTYHSVFLASIGFWVFVLWNAIMHQNFIQIIAINFYNFGLFIYSILQIVQTANDLNNVRGQVKDPNVASNSGYFLAAQILLPSIIGLFIPIYCYLTFQLHREFGWRMYRITGGEKVVTRAFTSYHILLLLLKFSAFSGTAFIILTLVLTSITEKGRIVIPLVGALVGIATLVAGYYGARFEIKGLMAFSIIGSLTIFGYTISRFVDAFRRGGREFERAKIPFLMFGVLSELMWLLTIVFSVVCWRNFGKAGLKDVLDQESRRAKGKYQPPPTVIE
ncbi:hypothetical protein BDR26DRAFT_849057 [Obelidium mucronatum]|nr:hypothetical protein BDR26DRAFT_849057 [Obelidium mucronatum]